jgi:hypothetical protein
MLMAPKPPVFQLSVEGRPDDVRPAEAIGLPLGSCRSRGSNPSRNSRLGSGPAEHNIGEHGRGVGLHAGQHVLVHAHREGDVGVPEALAHDLGRHAGLEEDRGVGVPQVVGTDPWAVGCLDQAVEVLAVRVRVDGRAVWLGEDERGILRPEPERNALLKVLGPPLPIVSPGVFVTELFGG